MRVQWRNGIAILSKIDDLKQRRAELKHFQDNLRVLVDRENALLASTPQRSGTAACQEDSGCGVADDVISVVHAPVTTLTADYFLLPTLPFLLFTYVSGDARQEPFIRGKLQLCGTIVVAW